MIRRLRKGFDGQPIDLEGVRRRSFVTKTAIDRWLERASAVSREDARAQILIEPVLHGLALGASRVVLGGLSYHLSHGQVVAIGWKAN